MSTKQAGTDTIRETQDLQQILYRTLPDIEQKAVSVDAKLPELVDGRIPVDLDLSNCTQINNDGIPSRGVQIGYSDTNEGAFVYVSENRPLPVRSASNDIVNGSSTIDSGGVSQEVFPYWYYRGYLFVQNVSDTNMYLGIGYTPTSSNGILLAANGGSFVMEGSFVARDAINILCASAGKAFVALTGGNG